MSSPSGSPNYKKIKEVFYAVLEVVTAERADFLNKNCPDEKIRREVESLLAAREAAGQFLEDVSAAEVVRDSINKNDQLIGQTIDKYLIEREIGRGGMGAVYLAIRKAGDFEKRVAVKIIKRGADSDESHRRFQQERRILAALEHPNIARLIDGGATSDGIPYLVLEYVEGVPIDEFCREKNLSVEEILEVFRKICAAVSYAHRNLIIHRDLKASNILVTADGEPKLLDFGIAKLFSNENEISDNYTRTNFQALTPEYASPEQLRGEKLTTATDVYSLGVILYELLTGTRPFTTRGKNIAEILEMVSQTNPPRPSSISNYEFQITNSKVESGSLQKNKQPTNPKSKIQNPKSLRGDLDNIVLKSLAKESERRYGSVEQFSIDLKNYLNGLPVSARKDSFWYRASKFVSRNRVGVTAVAMVFLLLVVGIMIVARQARIAENERAKAERRAENLRKLSSSFAVELHDAILNLPGSLAARQLLLTRAIEQLDALAAESEGNPQLQDELARGYYNLSQLPNVNLSDVEQNTQKAVNIYQKLLSDNPKSVLFRQQLAKGYSLQSNLQKVRGDTSGALQHLRKSIELIESVIRDEPDLLEHKNDLRDTKLTLAGLLTMTGKAREALEISREAQQLGEELAKNGKIADDFEQMDAVLHFEESKSLIYLGDYEAALVLLRRDLQIILKQSVAHPNDTRYRYELWAFRRNLALVVERVGDQKGALENLRSALELMENFLRSSPDDVGYQRNTSFTHLALGQFFVRQNQPEKALPHLRRALELSNKIYAKDAEKGETLEDLARIHSALGQTAVLLKNEAEGVKNFRQSLEFFQKGLARDPENASFRRDFAEMLGNFGKIEQKSQNPNDLLEAKDNFAQSLQIWQDLQTKNLLSYADTEQPKMAEQNLLKFESAAK
jgi:serine/threonine protein kinase